MPSTLIFPDLHEPRQAGLDTIETIIAAEKADRIVFLGDYFDRWSDAPADAKLTAQWLAQSLKDPRRVHLIGNHDASYLWPVETTFCPGFTWEKEAEVRAVLGTDAHTRFAFHTWADGWLLTHAGLSAHWVPEGLLNKKWLESEETKARRAFAAGRVHWFLEAGTTRGGRHKAGGILWCDHRELVEVPGVKQIYGHTPARSTRMNGTSLCLDTNFGDGVGPRHYATVGDGRVLVQSIKCAA